MKLTRLIVFLLAALSIGMVRAEGAPWPNQYVVHDGSQSPNGRYAVLVQPRELASENPDDAVTYLADLKSLETLGQIRSGRYFQGQNHRDFYVSWAPDSSWCVVTFDGRFGFDSIAVVELKTPAFKETEIGGQLHSWLNRKIGECDGGADARGDGPAFFRIHPDGRLQVRAAATDNPKAFDDRKTCYSLFQGTFNVGTGKWAVTDVRAISPENFSAAYGVYGEPDFTNSTFNSDEDRTASLDETLNEVYGFLRSILPAKKFAEIKKEQVAWLKTRDTAASNAEKCKLIEARIMSLRELAW